MKTTEEIKNGLVDPEVFCDHCTYNGEPNGCNHPNGLCQAWENADNAYELIQYLETFAPPVPIGTQIFSVCYTEDDDGFYVKSSVVVEIWYNCNGWFFLEECHEITSQGKIYTVGNGLRAVPNTQRVWNGTQAVPYDWQGG